MTYNMKKLEENGRMLWGVRGPRIAVAVVVVVIVVDFCSQEVKYIEKYK